MSQRREKRLRALEKRVADLEAQQNEVKRKAAVTPSIDMEFRSAPKATGLWARVERFFCGGDQ